MKKLDRFLVPALTFLFTLLPLLIFAHRFPRLAPFSLFANDAFYYLDVARNSQHLPFYSFDGVHPTNGFHPVWQYLLYQAVRLGYLDLNVPAQALLRLFYVNLLLVSLASAGLAAVIARHVRYRWIALISICPGWVWFLGAVTAPDYLAIWSYTNGMETAAELAALSLALLCIPRLGEAPSFTRVRVLPIVCFLLGLTVLCRLDDIFFLLPIAAFLVYASPRAGRRVALLSTVIPVAMIAAYLAYNIHTVHMAMPISGASKAGLALRPNLAGLLKVFLPTHWDTPEAWASLGYSVYSEGFMRTFQMFFPVLICGFYLLRPRSGRRTLVDALCAGVVLKGLYDFFFVSLWSQGHWYYGASVFVANLVIALTLDTILTGLLPQSGERRELWPRTLPVLIVVELLAILFSANAFINHKLDVPGTLQAEHIVEGGARVASMIHAAGGDRFIEFDDGILGFSTQMGSISGIGLVLDAEAMSARRQGAFFDLAIARGDEFVLSDRAYADGLEAFGKQAAVQPGANLYGIRSSEFMKYELQPVATDKQTDVRLYRLVRRAGTIAR